MIKMTLNNNLDKLMLKTSFVCTVCDGNIDEREINIIENLFSKTSLFNHEELQSELDKLTEEFNQNTDHFIKEYLSELQGADLSESQQLQIIKTAIETIKADENVDYNEIKFFKLLRNQLSISNESILEEFPEIEVYLEPDAIYISIEEQMQSIFNNIRKITMPKINIP